MLEHYSHIRIDAKRQGSLDAARRSPAHNGDGNGDGANRTEIPAIVEVSERPHVTVTSQFGLAWIAACPFLRSLASALMVTSFYAS
jgi:hypothetical protein